MKGGTGVHLAHPVYVKPFAKKHVKTDKVDAWGVSAIVISLIKSGYV